MTGLFGSADPLSQWTGLSRWTERWEAQLEQARVSVLATVLTDMQNFPLVLLDDDNLPSVKVSLRQHIRLFPLGECQRIWLPGLTGFTTLHFGSDGQLYEYGPKVTDSYEADDPFFRNTIELRKLQLDKLEVHELWACRDLLRRVWLV